MLDSALVFAFHPIPYSDRPDGSFLDMHKLCKEHFIFTASLRGGINKTFYRSSAPKFPLRVTLRLTDFGNTTFGCKYEISSPGYETYATFTSFSVLVNMKTRKPTPAPQWWQTKYTRVIQQKPHQKIDTVRTQVYSSCLEVTILYSDTDEYCHTNWATYIRLCYDAFMNGIVTHAYRCISEEEASNGVKYFEITYQKESVLGDKLRVMSSEIYKNEKKELLFDVWKGSDLCCRAKMGFHKNGSNDLKAWSKL